VYPEELVHSGISPLVQNVIPSEQKAPLLDEDELEEEELDDDVEIIHIPAPTLQPPFWKQPGELPEQQVVSPTGQE